MIIIMIREYDKGAHARRGGRGQWTGWIREHCLASQSTHPPALTQSPRTPFVEGKDTRQETASHKFLLLPCFLLVLYCVTKFSGSRSLHFFFFLSVGVFCLCKEMAVCVGRCLGLFWGMETLFCYLFFSLSFTFQGDKTMILRALPQN